MFADAQQGAPLEITPAPGRLPVVHVVYALPPGDFQPFESRLRAAIRPFGDDVRLTRTRTAELCRFTRETPFLSGTLPNLMLLSGGAIVAHAVGDLPAGELELLVAGAVRRVAS